LQHLYTYYDSNARNLFKGVTDWVEAVRRARNKRGTKEIREAGYAGQGLYGHQEKMVSMQLYFQDWEGWLKKRFPYPAPSDLHNKRVAVAGKGLVVQGLAGDNSGEYGGVVIDDEMVAKPWRDSVLRYIIEFKEDPIDVADVLWLFSNLMCGNSPLTATSKNPKTNGSGMFDVEDLPHADGVQKFLHPKFRKDLEATCLICPFLQTCNFAIPARPYYDKGWLVFRPRPKVEDHIDRTHLKEPVFTTPTVSTQHSFINPN
jgi:hypothetical protein